MDPLLCPPPICFHVEPQWQPHGGTLAHAASANPLALDSKCITSLSLGLGVFDLSGVLVPLSDKHSFLVSNSVLTDQGQTNHCTPHPPSPLRHSLGGSHVLLAQEERPDGGIYATPFFLAHDSYYHPKWLPRSKGDSLQKTEDRES